MNKCPACHHKFLFRLKDKVASHLPPTGKDYDWTEHRESLKCPKCKEYLLATVRRTTWGTDPQIMKLELDYNPDWGCYRLFWSPKGEWLAVTVSNKLRIFDAKNHWQLILELKDSSFIEWGEEDLITVCRYKEKFNYYEVWSVLAQQKKCKAKLLDEYWSNLDAVAINKNCQVIAYGGRKDYNTQRLEIYDMANNHVYSVETCELSIYNSKVWFNLSKDLALCAKAAAYLKNNSLTLWKIDIEKGIEKGTFSKTGEYISPITTFEWAAWDSEGNILVVELHNKDGLQFHRNIPYGLVLLDGTDLSVKKRLTQLPKKLCPHMAELRHLQILSSGLIAWCSNKIHFIDANTWEYKGSVPYKLDSLNPIVLDPEGQFAAIGLKNDLAILNLKTLEKFSVRDSVESISIAVP